MSDGEPRGRLFRKYVVVLLVLAAETLFFSLVAPNFFTLGNFFEMTRFSVELGLLHPATTSRSPSPAIRAATSSAGSWTTPNPTVPAIRASRRL